MPNEQGSQGIHVDESWVIASAGAEKYLGKRVASEGADGLTVSLQPAYFLVTAVEKGEFHQTALPAEFLLTPGAVLKVRASALVDLGTASREDRQRIAKMVGAAEAMRTRMRAKQAGLVLTQ